MGFPSLNESTFATMPQVDRQEAPKAMPPYQIDPGKQDDAMPTPPCAAQSFLRQIRGFTLVELLVVIGIIALLIAILLPALSRARSASLEVKGLANLKSLGQAATLHAHDHRGFFPIAGAIWRPATSATPAGLPDSRQQHYVYYPD